MDREKTLETLRAVQSGTLTPEATTTLPTRGRSARLAMPTRDSGS